VVTESLAVPPFPIGVALRFRAPGGQREVPVKFTVTGHLPVTTGDTTVGTFAPVGLGIPLP
jgi:hypothetical protein